MPRLTRKVPSAELATKIVRAVRSKKNYVMAPWSVRLAPLGKELLPLSVGEKLLDWMGITDGMRDWIGSGEQLSSPPISGSHSSLSRLTGTLTPTRRQPLHPPCTQEDEDHAAGGGLERSLSHQLTCEQDDERLADNGRKSAVER